MCIGQEADRGAGPLGFAGYFHRRYRYPALVFLGMNFTVEMDIDSAPLGKAVDHRGADAVQTAGYGIRLAAEFSAGMEHGHNCFQGGYFSGGVNPHRDTAPVVLDADGFILFNNGGNLITAAGHSFIDAVIDNFVNQMMEPALVGAADVHPGTPPHRLQATENENILGGIFGGFSFLDIIGIFHKRPH